jgi:hypothetical protein
MRSGGPLTGHDILILTARHAAEYAGQAELTRQLLDEQRRAATTQSEA